MRGTSGKKDGRKRHSIRRVISAVRIGTTVCGKAGQDAGRDNGEKRREFSRAISPSSHLNRAHAAPSSLRHPLRFPAGATVESARVTMNNGKHAVVGRNEIGCANRGVSPERAQKLIPTRGTRVLLKELKPQANCFRSTVCESRR